MLSKLKNNVLDEIDEVENQVVRVMGELVECVQGDMGFEDDEGSTIRSFLMNQLPLLWIEYGELAQVNVRSFAAFHALIGSTTSFPDGRRIVSAVDLTGDQSIVMNLLSIREKIIRQVESESTSSIKGEIVKMVRVRLGLDS